MEIDKIIDLTFIKGKITYDDFSFLKNFKNSRQIESLKENLFQVEYLDTYLLDVGWYASFDINGSFEIRVIKAYDWNTPLFFSQTESIKTLLSKIIAAQKKIKQDQLPSTKPTTKTKNLDTSRN
ncbi:hypothetical protein [Pseudomonas sp. B21-053]|uniref:hypothetical protein n=1 Tax=Pseudomonas sp. B21-053 TaxID=2895493 RepID=UPI00222EC7DF|nr:hypothetical protein [Pseudomonas sp. B21-053]UZE13821.1 hypothetical protein LOY68_09475 [Pseudomonas sp. B21-053]